MIMISTLKQKTNLREIVLYGFTGVATTVVNLGVYHILLWFSIDYKIANLIALITCKSCAYWANKQLVFQSHCESWMELGRELIRYIAARSFTGIVDYVGLIICVDVVGADKIISKYVLQVIVIILNYILGKFMVFNKKSKRG